MQTTQAEDLKVLLDLPQNLYCLFQTPILSRIIRGYSTVLVVFITSANLILLHYHCHQTYIDPHFSPDFIRAGLSILVLKLNSMHEILEFSRFLQYAHCSLLP